MLQLQAQKRREGLLETLDRLADGAGLSREEALDIVLAIFDDAHSAEPVLFGGDAAEHFARLHEARSALSC